MVTHHPTKTMQTRYMSWAYRASQPTLFKLKGQPNIRILFSFIGFRMQLLMAWLKVTIQNKLPQTQQRTLLDLTWWWNYPLLLPFSALFAADDLEELCISSLSDADTSKERKYMEKIKQQLQLYTWKLFFCYGDNRQLFLAEVDKQKMVVRKL